MADADRSTPAPGGDTAFAPAGEGLREAASRAVAQKLGYGRGPNDFDLWHSPFSLWTRCVAVADAVLALSTSPPPPSSAGTPSASGEAGLRELEGDLRRRAKAAFDRATAYGAKMEVAAVASGKAAAYGHAAEMAAIQAALSTPPVSDTAGEALMIPREPTEAMMRAGLYASGPVTDWAEVNAMWKAMFDAVSLDGGTTDQLPATPPAAAAPTAAPGAAAGLTDGRLRELVTGALNGGQTFEQALRDGPRVSVSTLMQALRVSALSAPVEAEGEGRGVFIDHQHVIKTAPPSATEGLEDEEWNGTAEMPVGSPRWCSMMQVRLAAARQASTETGDGA